MKLKRTVTAAGLAALLGVAGLTGSVAGQDQDHGRQDGMMQGMDHDQTMQGMSHGGARGGGQAQSEGGHNAHSAEAPATSGSPATEAYRIANLAMHRAMDIEFSDNADIDFARGMIGHHQGAIDMARIVLEHGEDRDLRQLAGEIIEAQEAEIAFLRQWIAEHVE